MGIKDIRTRLERQKGARTKVQQSISKLIETIKNNRRQLIWHEKAREIIKDIGLKTQQQLQYNISDITSLALEAVFDDPYELIAEFIQRRNKTECDLLFVRDGERMDPLTASGGGTVDVTAFALRVASWSMQNPKSRNTIILDEPMRFVSEAYQEKASQMIKEVSQRLGVQFIIITHNSVLASYADRTFESTIKKGITKITQL
jgi:DNA repair exonuclease SbcCD ATPase subunit